METEAVEEIAQGRVWQGDKALELGLVDALGDLNTAIEPQSWRRLKPGQYVN